MVVMGDFVVKRERFQQPVPTKQDVCNVRNIMAGICK
jgi:hypothetical protein